MAADIQRVKDRIAEIAGRRANVRVNEIEWVVTQLEKFDYTVTAKSHAHGIFYSVNEHSFNICTHHKGSSQVRPTYVTDFLNAMIELELL